MKAKTEDTPKLPKQVIATLKDAIIMRAKAKAMEDEAKMMSEEAKAILLPIFEVYDLKTYAVAGVGSAISKVSKGSNINAEKLKIALLTSGVDIDVIDSAIVAASNTWNKPYIEFKAEKS
jgi:uncharacterized membrane protein